MSARPALARVSLSRIMDCWRVIGPGMLNRCFKLTKYISNPPAGTRINLQRSSTYFFASCLTIVRKLIWNLWRGFEHLKVWEEALERRHLVLRSGQIGDRRLFFSSSRGTSLFPKSNNKWTNLASLLRK